MLHGFITDLFYRCAFVDAKAIVPFMKVLGTRRCASQSSELKPWHTPNPGWLWYDVQHQAVQKCSKLHRWLPHFKGAYTGSGLAGCIF
jgi:hypothetical protein